MTDEFGWFLNNGEAPDWDGYVEVEYTNGVREPKPHRVRDFNWRYADRSGYIIKKWRIVDAPAEDGAPPTSTYDTQIGGSHYKDMPIQPLEYMIRNKLGAAEGKVVKYVTRWKDKGGIDDLKKARHVLDFYIETLEKYPELTK